MQCVHLHMCLLYALLTNNITVFTKLLLIGSRETLILASYHSPFVFPDAASETESRA